MFMYIPVLAVDYFDTILSRELAHNLLEHSSQVKKRATLMVACRCSHGHIAL